ncbi:MAG TPA: hypothetical protein PLO59_08255 [Bacteroidia bacterium]|nr:hypothetical protein [Bacteroidia bacterium]
MHISYTETQYFGNWIRIILILLLFPVGMLSAVKLSNAGNTSHLLAAIITFAISVALLLLFWKAHLSTSIDNYGISYQFKPFHLKQKTINWDDVKLVELMKYKPIQMYGGWGLRYSFKYGWAYNVSGNYGLKIYAANKKPVLIGTNQLEKMQETIMKLNQDCKLKYKLSLN